MSSHVHEFHIRLVGKPGVTADLRPYRLPGMAVHAEVRLVDKDYEVGIACGDHGSFHWYSIGEMEDAHSHVRHTHGRGNAKDLAGACVDAADARSGVGFKDDFVARAGLGFVGNPSGCAPGSVTGYFCNGPVGIVQTDAGLAMPLPGQELHTIGAYALIAVAESAREMVPGFDPGEIFLDYQKIVSAGVRLDELYHSRRLRTGSLKSSALRNMA
jgi:hypothetical protein